MFVNEAVNGAETPALLEPLKPAAGACGTTKIFLSNFDEAELATIILCVRSLVEIGCWSDLVRYCVYRIEESMDETLLEEMDEESAVVH